jgi:hypothetical protein
MHHSVDERPEERVGAETAEESVRQQRFPRDEVFFRVRSGLDDEKSEESQQRHKVEEEDSSCASRERWKIENIENPSEIQLPLNSQASEVFTYSMLIRLLRTADSL